MLKKILLTLLLLVGMLISASVYFSYQQMHKPLALSHVQFYRVSTGDNYHHVIRDFKEKNWISSRFAYRIFARFEPDKTAIKTGLYQVNPKMTFYQLLRNMNRGKEHQFKVTFVEGSTFAQWRTTLRDLPYIKVTIDNKSAPDIMQQLGSEFTHPEGLFFPDTYAYTAGMKDLDILKQAYQRMANELAQSWQGKSENVPYKTPYEALIMASIIEKETGQVNEQPLISSVFVNRLAKRMRLQTDPTIIYGLGERYTGDITYANIREKTAYNTYQIDGLPPSPIAMPGKSAIEATLHPSATKYLYFVSKGNGEHHFSTTLKEHNRAVDRYIRGIK